MRRVLFSEGGKEVITVSDDKTIRIWNAATGQSLRTLRPPIGKGSQGNLFAAALHPQGKVLAVAGFGPIGNVPIYLIRLSDGQVEKVLRGHKNGIRSVAFSPDGDRLASGGRRQDRTRVGPENGTGTFRT